MSLSVGAVWMWPRGCSVPSADPDVLCKHLEPAVMFLEDGKGLSCRQSSGGCSDPVNPCCSRSHSQGWGCLLREGQSVLGRRSTANNWNLQCRERRIWRADFSPLQVLGICWGGRNQLCGVGLQGGTVRPHLAEPSVLCRCGGGWPCHGRHSLQRGA